MTITAHRNVTTIVISGEVDNRRILEHVDRAMDCVYAVRAEYRRTVSTICERDGRVANAGEAAELADHDATLEFLRGIRVAVQGA